MSQKSVIEVIPVIENKYFLEDFDFQVGFIYQSEIFTDLQTACDAKGWVYNTLSRKGSSFRFDDGENEYIIQRKHIIRKGGQDFSFNKTEC